jgi:ABC-2 type transport system permease protein
MSTAAISYSAPATPDAAAHTVRIFAKEIQYEFLKLLRTKPFFFATVGFPVMFYVLFGVANRHVVEGGVQIAKYMLGGYACFGLIGAALFGVGVGMATEINAGWLEVKRASPMPPMAYLAAKCATAIAFGLIIVSILIGIGIAFGGVTLTALEIVKMLGLAVAGSVTFTSMGLLLAQIVPANAAPGIINLIYLPMSFLSGLWIPLSELPHWVRQIAPTLPTYHLAQLMVGIYGRGYTDRTAPMHHWFGLIGFTLVMLGASWAVFNRTQRNA